ncbi:MAG: hypothetical protein EON96_09455, partial [Caulobacteraceae bacterium]
EKYSTPSIAKPALATSCSSREGEGSMPPGKMYFWMKSAWRRYLAMDGVEYFSDDYGQTLREWRDRFEAAAPQVVALGFDQKFLRMWRFYLAYCEAGFRTRRTEVGQWTISKP